MISNKYIKEIRDLYKIGYSLRKLEKLGYKRRELNFSLEGIKRTRSQSCTLAHDLYSENYKQNEKTKSKRRKIRLKFMKANPEKTAWRKKNLSYPEKLFIELSKRLNLGKKYDIIREYSFYPYYIDFAFLNIRLAIEVDGSQHWKNIRQIKHDKKRDKYITENGWKILRIPEFKLRKKDSGLDKEIIKYLDNIELKEKIYNFKDDIVEFEKLKKLKLKEKKDKQKKKLKERKLEIIINREKLIDIRKKDLEKINISKRGSIGELCRLWNVSHTQVRRFIKKHIKEYNFSSRVNYMGS